MSDQVVDALVKVAGENAIRLRSQDALGENGTREAWKKLVADIGGIDKIPAEMREQARVQYKDPISPELATELVLSGDPVAIEEAKGKYDMTEDMRAKLDKAKKERNPHDAVALTANITPDELQTAIDAVKGGELDKLRKLQEELTSKGVDMDAIDQIQALVTLKLLPVLLASLTGPKASQPA